jgi:hypothetical protein
MVPALRRGNQGGEGEVIQSIPTDPELAALLEKARGHVMTPDEIAAQRRSWVVGELMLQHPEMTKAEADARYDEMLVKLGYSAPVEHR